MKPRYVMLIPFAAVHLAVFAAFFTGVSAWSLALFAGLYAVMMFGVTAGYHRYFSHRTFKTSRPFQFVLALLAMISAQKGVVWWAAHHRHHHKNSDEPDDVHSPRQHGFWYAHVGWILAESWTETDLKKVKDLACYPELRWLDRHPMVPPVTFGLLVGLVGGFEALVVGYLWAIVACWHVTYCINSLAHVWGTRRYGTEDDSKNNLLLALLTHGEGWHNNHHHFQASARQGFKWWEIDVSYYVLRALSAVGLVWDLRVPPPHVIRDEPHPRVLARRRAAEEARRLAESVREAAGSAAETAAGRKQASAG